MSGDVRLLLLNCEFPPIGGGAATATRFLMRELACLPMRVTLVTAGLEKVARTEDLSSNCRVHYLPVGKADLHYWTNRELLAYTVAASRFVARLSRHETFDLCHAFFTLPVGAVAWWHRESRPYIVSLCGSDVPGFSGRYAVLYNVAGRLFNVIWRDAAAVVSPSDDLKQLARRTAPDLAIEVIPNGVDTGEFHPGAWRENARTILTVARLVPRKDIATPIRAVAALAREFADIRFVVVGDGPEAPRLGELAGSLGVADRIDFVSYVPREKIADVYRQADVFVLTSEREGMSNTMLEAIASGLPMVASDDALAGISMAAAARPSPGDVAATAEGIARLLRNGQARKDAAAASREAAAKYAWPAVARSYFQLYQRIIEAGGKRPQ